MKTSIVLTSFIFCIATSFYIGFQLGADQYYLGSAQYRMMEHFGYLKAANRGDIEQIKSLSNSQIDSEFVIHTVWQDSKWQWLLPAMQTDNDKYAKAIATYRLSHPYQQKPIDLSNFSDSDKELMQQRFNDHQQDIKRAYDRYRK